MQKKKKKKQNYLEKKQEKIEGTKQTIYSLVFCWFFDGNEETWGRRLQFVIDITATPIAASGAADLAPRQLPCFLYIVNTFSLEYISMTVYFHWNIDNYTHFLHHCLINKIKITIEKKTKKKHAGPSAIAVRQQSCCPGAGCRRHATAHAAALFGIIANDAAAAATATAASGRLLPQSAVSAQRPNVFRWTASGGTGSNVAFNLPRLLTTGCLFFLFFFLRHQ